MGKRDEKHNLKFCVLKKIKENKSVLFEALTKMLTKDIKNKAWKDIMIYSQSLGVISSNKDAVYLRDVWWPNVRKSSLNKIDNARQTGSGGGTDQILIDVDKIVLEIIGKDSPVIEGLGVSDSIETEISSRPTITEDTGNENIATSSENNCMPMQESVDHCESMDRSESTEKGVSLSNVTWRTKKSTMNTMQHRGNPLKEKLDEKHQLQTELMKINIYKTKLECRQLELALGIPVSELTNDIPHGENIFYNDESNVVVIDSNGSIIGNNNYLNNK